MTITDWAVFLLCNKWTDCPSFPRKPSNVRGVYMDPATVSTRMQVYEYKCFSQCQLPPRQWQKGRESLESSSPIPRESRTLNVHFPKLVLHGKISCFLKWLIKGGNSCPCFAGLSDIYMFVHSMPLSTHSGRTEEESRARTAHTESK